MAYNTLSTALDLGTLSSKSLTGFIGVSDTSDYYRFALGDTSNFSALINGTSQSYLGLRLIYDRNNNNVIDSGDILYDDYVYSSGNGNINSTLGAGTYFIGVTQGNSNTNTNYSLSLSSSATPSSVSDPGNSLNTAYNLGTLSGTRSFNQFIGVTDTSDYYRFALGDTSNFSALINSTNQSYLGLRLIYDRNNNNVIDSGDILYDDYVYSSGNGNINASLGAGTYFVGVTQGNSNTNTNYTLQLTGPQLTRTTLKQNPSAYMGGIRDYDGNDLGSGSSWRFIGDADVQGDGDSESVFVNSSNGRWATVGDINGIVDFSKNGLGGDTRVVGIYIDPTLKNQPQNIGGPFDSQRRFQNDLRINNLSVLATADYDKDGFQDMYFKLGDGTAVLRALMHKDGNIQYANYQSEADLTTFMTANNVSSSIWGGWL
jgi:hypothetical protein